MSLANGLSICRTPLRTAELASSRDEHSEVQGFVPVALLIQCVVVFTRLRYSRYIPRCSASLGSFPNLRIVFKAPDDSHRIRVIPGASTLAIAIHSTPRR